MKSRRNIRRNPVYVGFTDYWTNIYCHCAKSETLCVGPLGEYFCMVMWDMPEEEFDRRAELTRKAPKTSRAQVDFLTYCDRICTWYNYEIITNDDLYSKAIKVVEDYLEGLEF